MNLIDESGSDLEREYDCIMVAGSSDYRAYEILRKYQKSNVSIKRVLLFDFNERTEKNIELSKEDNNAYNSYKTLGFQVTSIPCSIFDPSACLKSLNKSELNLSADTKFAIDISCFTKPYFFSILRYLKEQVGFKAIRVFYTEPMSYTFNKGFYHSTYGPLSVIEIPGYPGLDTGTIEKILIVLLGFEGEFSSYIYDQVSPDKIMVINGFPAYSPKFKDISIINNEKLVINSGSHKYYVSANNPFETFNLLENLKKNYPKAFFNIAPLGTKPMALGACLFAILYPSVRIVYPLPEKYANKTTSECCCSWSYTIPLNIECDS